MEVDPMIIVKKFNDVSELQKLQRIACSVPEDVYLHSMDDSIMVDAKSFINLFKRLERNFRSSETYTRSEIQIPAGLV